MENYKDQLQEDYLIHFGVPGMRWGHRKDRGTVGERRSYYHQRLSREQAKRSLVNKSNPMAAKLAKKHKMSTFDFMTNNANKNIKKSVEYRKDQKAYSKVSRQEARANSKLLRESEKAARQSTKEKYGTSSTTSTGVKIAGAALAAGITLGIAKKKGITAKNLGNNINKIFYKAGTVVGKAKTNAQIMRTDPKYGKALRRQILRR